MMMLHQSVSMNVSKASGAAPCTTSSARCTCSHILHVRRSQRTCHILKATATPEANPAEPKPKRGRKPKASQPVGNMPDTELEQSGAMDEATFSASTADAADSGSLSSPAQSSSTADQQSPEDIPSAAATLPMPPVVRRQMVPVAGVRVPSPKEIVARIAESRVITGDDVLLSNTGSESDSEVSTARTDTSDNTDDMYSSASVPTTQANAESPSHGSLQDSDDQSQSASVRQLEAAPIDIKQLRSSARKIAQQRKAGPRRSALSGAYTLPPDERIQAVSDEDDTAVPSSSQEETERKPRRRKSVASADQSTFVATAAVTAGVGAAGAAVATATTRMQSLQPSESMDEPSSPSQATSSQGPSTRARQSRIDESVSTSVPRLSPVLEETEAAFVRLRGAAILEDDVSFINELRIHALRPSTPAAFASVVGKLSQYVDKARDSGSAEDYRKRFRQLVFSEEGVMRRADDSAVTSSATSTAAVASSGPMGEVDAVVDEVEVQGSGSALDVYVPEVEVINDVVFKILGVKLPPKAFYGTRAQALARLSTQECKAQCKLWLDICGPQYATAFIGREPRLLTMSPASLLITLEAITNVLNLDASGAVDWALRNTGYIQMMPTQDQLESKVQEIMQVLKIDRPKAVIILKRVTMLLTYAPGDLQTRLDVLSELVPVSKAKLIMVLARRPQLLARSASSTAARLAFLAALTQLPLRSAGVMSAAQPGLLGGASATLLHRWQRIVMLCSKYAPWRQQLVSMSPAGIARCLAASDSAITRLAIIQNYNMQDFESASDLKMLIAMTQAQFKNKFMREAQQRRKVSGSMRALSARRPDAVAVKTSQAQLRLQRKAQKLQGMASQGNDDSV